MEQAGDDPLGDRATEGLRTRATERRARADGTHVELRRGTWSDVVMRILILAKSAV